MTGERGRQIARKALSVLKRTHGQCRVCVKRPALEELLVGILADGASENKASAALSAISSSFVDWNEVRVSSAYDIAAAMPEMAHAVKKADIIRNVLQRVYDVTNEMALEFLNDKNPRDISRLVADVQDFPENALARAVVLKLGHEVMPLTRNAVAVLKRLGLVDDAMDHAAMAAEVKKFVPRNSMYDLHWLLCRHASGTCLPENPLCNTCGMRTDCRTGRASVSKTQGGAGRRARKQKISRR